MQNLINEPIPTEEQLEIPSSEESKKDKKKDEDQEGKGCVIM